MSSLLNLKDQDAQFCVTVAWESLRTNHFEYAEAAYKAHAASNLFSSGDYEGAMFFALQSVMHSKGAISPVYRRVLNVAREHGVDNNYRVCGGQS